MTQSNQAEPSNTYSEEDREADQAMVFLETYGSTSYRPVEVDGYRWAESGYAPEWLSEGDLEADPDTCLTVLHYGYGDPVAPFGYEEAYRYECGERQCTDCEGTGHAYNHETEKHDPNLKCPLCEGDRFIYWGEEWSVVVFRPRYLVGAGQIGCLYDWGPERTTSRKAAWESVRDMLESVGLSRRSLGRVARDLTRKGIHYFDRRLRPFVGLDYVEISD